MAITHLDSPFVEVVHEGYDFREREDQQCIVQSRSVYLAYDFEHVHRTVEFVGSQNGVFRRWDDIGSLLRS